MKEQIAYNSRFSHISDIMGRKYLFFDFELQSMFSQIKECWSIIQRVKKRFDRKETCRISKTQTSYMELVRDMELYPYALYNFQNKDVTIAIVQLHRLYYVYCEGYSPSSCYVKVSVEIGRDLYSPQETLKESINDFHSIVIDYISVSAGKLPF